MTQIMTQPCKEEHVCVHLVAVVMGDSGLPSATAVLLAMLINQVPSN
jgi:hypothetical protein